MPLKLDGWSYHYRYQNYSKEDTLLVFLLVIVFRVLFLLPFLVIKKSSLEKYLCKRF